MKFAIFITIIIANLFLAFPAHAQQQFELIYPLQHNAQTKVKFAPLTGGKRFLTLADQQPILYDLFYGISIKKLPKHSGAVTKVINSGNNFFTLGDADIFSFDQDGNQLRHFSYGAGRGMQDFDVSNTYVAGGGFENIYIWNTVTGKIVSVASIGYDSWTEQVSFINNGNQFITRGTYYTGKSIVNSSGDGTNHHYDSTIYVWDTKTGLPVAKVPSGKGSVDMFRYNSATNQLIFLAGGLLHSVMLPKLFTAPVSDKEKVKALSQQLITIPVQGYITDFEIDFKTQQLVLNIANLEEGTEMLHFLNLQGKQLSDPIEPDMSGLTLSINNNWACLDFRSRTIMVDLISGKKNEMYINSVAPVNTNTYLCNAGASRDDLMFNPAIQLRSFAGNDTIKEFESRANYLATAYTNRFGQLGLLGTTQCDLLDISNNSKLKYQPLEYGSFNSSRYVQFDSLLVGSHVYGGSIFVTNTLTGETKEVNNIPDRYYTAITGATSRHLVGIVKDTIKLFNPHSFAIERSFPQEQLNHFKGKESRRISDPFDIIKKIPAVAVMSDDEQLLACSETDSTLLLSDGNNHLLHRINIPAGSTEFTHMQFLKGSHTLLYFSADKVFSVNGNTGTISAFNNLQYILDDVVQTVELNDARYILVVTDMGSVLCLDKFTGDSLWTTGWYNEWVNVEFTDDKQYGFGWDESHNVSVFNTSNGKIICRIPTKLGSLIDGVLDLQNNRFIAISSDFTVHIFDLTTNKKEISIIDQLSDNLVTVTSDNYYASTKGSVSQLFFKKQQQIIAPEQLDVKYNRPDIVLQRLKNPNTQLITSLRKAYEKRLARLGLDSAKLTAIEQTPVANMPAQQLPQLVKQKVYSLKLSFKDATFPLVRMNVWVNGVPLFGSRGLPLSKGKKQLDTTIQLKLTTGANVIEYSATNTAGAESYRSPLTIKYQPAKPERSDVYFIGIGIDQFKEPGHPLNWSVKDITDLALKLKQRNPDLLIDTLFNTSVTVANVQSLRKYLADLREEDKVIIAYSGHGLLDQQGNYFLSTYDVNFESPAQNGLAYETIESLLDGIAPRRKLLLLDACHSGEVDKEEISKIEANKGSLDSMGTKVKSNIKISTSKKLGMTSSFELMQNLFMNVSRGTGASVISAAGGMQYAQERADLRNGVFTYSIIDAFNNNENLTITQLKQIVSENVLRLTNGLQKPTSRTETKYDWLIW